jgi:hypothetical protein
MEYTQEIRAKLRETTFQGIGSSFLSLSMKGPMGKLRHCLLYAAAITADCEKLDPDFNSSAYRRLVKASRALHHQLLSVPSESEASDAGLKEEDRLLFSITRLAAFIYHDIVIFPQVETAGIKPLLAARIRQALSRMSTKLALEDGTVTFSGLVLWILLLGSIGATWTADRKWFVQQLCRRSARIGINTFAEFKALVSRCLWFHNMDDPALKAWTEGGGAAYSSTDNT